jgi:alkylhydroperoxidase/carboxymuconolactone decarboxylase family protein YurZ
MGALDGDRALLGYAAPDNPITGALYPTAIEYGYGEIWFRPGLERHQRSLVAVAAFTARRLPEQVAKFGQSALNVGLSKTEVLVSAGITVFYLTAALVVPAVGKAIDRHGSRRVMAGGVGAMGYVATPWQLHAAFVCMGSATPRCR